MRDHRSHLAKPSECRLLAKLLFQEDASAEVVEEAGELPFTAERRLANSQVPLD